MVDSLSLIPLHLETFFDNRESYNLHTSVKIADATGFIFQKGFQQYLITNWHVVTGRNPETGKPLSKRAATPNVLRVMFHGHKLGYWLGQKMELLDLKTDEKKWIEHPRKQEVDVVAIPLEKTLFKQYPLYDVLFNTKLDVLPSDMISIVGFPFGIPSSGSYPIWKTGHIASDIDEDYDEKPVFLIDATVRPGMSGSPVIARSKKFVSEDKRLVITLENLDRFLGVFSGNISKKYDSEIGMVWKPEVINEIIEGKDELMKKVKRYKKLDLF